jgi:hypothetical protein
MEIDIREHKEEGEITKIVFSEDDPCVFAASYIENYGKAFPRIYDEMGEHLMLPSSVEGVENLIKALEKAKQLGWFK